MSQSPLSLSIVTSLYQSEEFLTEFHARCTAAATRLAGSSYEIILVNDGSPDQSLQKAIDLHARDPHVRVIDLSRNFGHHKALMTGLAHARGELVFLIDCDLEEDPAWLLTFHEAMRADNVDVVYGVQAERKGDWLERSAGRLFFSVFTSTRSSKSFAYQSKVKPVHTMLSRDSLNENTIMNSSGRYRKPNTRASQALPKCFSRSGFMGCPISVFQRPRQ